MSVEIHGCPECEANLAWHGDAMANSGHYECSECNTSYANVEEIKAKALAKAKEAGKQVK